MEEPVVALLAGLAQALVAELVLGLVLLAPRGTLRERTLQEVQVAQCKAPLAKVPTQEWAAMSAPRAPARPIPAQAQIPKSAGSSLECGLRNETPGSNRAVLSSLILQGEDLAGRRPRRNRDVSFKGTFAAGFDRCPPGTEKALASPRLGPFLSTTEPPRSAVARPQPGLDLPVWGWGRYQVTRIRSRHLAL